MNNSLRAVFTIVLVGLATSVWAHVVVTPRQAGVGSWVTFSVSVPNEKDVANTELKLVLPGTQDVTPTVKPGWVISIEKNAEGHASAIVWKGQLPAGFRDDITFMMQVPATPGDLVWKAYQTYQGGAVVGWEVDPSAPEAHDAEAMEKTGKGPYSVTRVVNDLGNAPAPGLELPLSVVALVLSLVAAVLAALALRRRT